ncbi:MAG: DUF262 domain-containing protein [Hyphomicrobiaceae bacterium]
MLTAILMTIRELFSGKNHYRLPRFQRHYAWTEDVAGKLLDDILEALPLKTDDGAPRNYFLGAIITIPSFNKADDNKSIIPGRNVRNVDVIDGQQRLVTLTLLISVLRDLLGGATAKNLQKLVAGANKSATPYRMSLREDDEEVFATCAKQPGSTRNEPPSDDAGDTIRNLFANRESFSGQREGLERREATLPALVEYLLDQCKVVVIEADQHDDAHQIYETLNQEGVELSRSSHIKSIAFRDAPKGDPEIDALAKDWDEWERKIGDERLDRLFSVIRSIHGDATKPIVSENARIIREAGGCKGYINNVLRPSVNAYLRIEAAIRGEGAEHPEIRKYLVYLNWLNHTDWYGPVIKWLHLNPNDDEATIAFLKRLDQLAFGLLLKGATANERTPRFKRVEKEITGRILPKSNAAIDLEKGEQERILYRISNDFQNTAGRPCKMLLVRLSDALGGTLTEVIPEKTSIEHVLPRRVSKKSPWMPVFPVAEVRNRCCKRLANMVLLPTDLNRSINTLDFEAKKKKIFFDKTGEPRLMTFAITNDLAQHQAWTQDVIDAREDQLIAIVREMWNLNGRAGRELDD